MSNQTEPEIILYDLACNQGVCFSPVVWRIRLMLNYKNIPYRTVFVEFPDIEPTLKGFGLIPDESAVERGRPYTVPAIQHVPSNRYMMDSAPIAQFLESAYPDPPVLLTSELGRKIEMEGRAAFGPILVASVMPREPGILSPRAAEYFRRTREASLGHRLEDLLDSDKEERSWSAVDDSIRAVGELMLTHKAQGPFVLGLQPSYTDFFITGTLQSIRMVDENVFQRVVAYPGYKVVYDACLPYMGKRD